MYLPLLLAAALVPATGPAPDTVPLYDNLGDHHYGVTTADATVQAYFDQGLRLYYAFNHAEAIRSFRAAQRLDPSCAMCWWGEALAWGPNINLPMDSASAVAAFAALQEARARRHRVTPRERAFIDALSRRYAPHPPGDRAALDSAYARAMGQVAERYPDDPEAAVLHGEALMDLRPWDYWNDEGEPEPGIPTALERFEFVMEADPDHPGACHFFIHAVEAVDPDRALPCAERLAGLMPGAGHLVHMPGHIYIRVGRYLDAVEANHHAVHADESWIQDQRPGMGMYTAGYYPHNYDFLAFAETMTGRASRAEEAAASLRQKLPDPLMGEPGMLFLQNWSTRPLQVAVRFARWDDVLAAGEPPADRVHARAMWHYARGRARAARGELEGAATELEGLRAAAGDPALDGMRLEFNLSTDVLGVAEAVLAGRLAQARGDDGKAVEWLREAVRREDDLLYGEPPEWTVPTRHDLGAVLLDQGRYREAEAVYRQDLERFRENGWALSGLARALEGQDRRQEAQAVTARFAEAWRAAEVEPRALGY